MSDQTNKAYENELLQILESNLEGKQTHIQRLAEYYPDEAQNILQSFAVWEDLKELKTPSISVNLDNTIYKMLEAKTGVSQSKVQETKVLDLNPKVKPLFTLRRMAMGMILLAGVAIGSLLDFGNKDAMYTVAEDPQLTSIVKFASLEASPLASERIKGIHQLKESNSPNERMLAALNKVLCNDPNINVRLSALETLLLFSDMPEAREILVRAIPYQTSPSVQLELADIMLELEEVNSVSEWEQLFESNNVETDIKQQLKNTLKTIL